MNNTTSVAVEEKRPSQPQVMNDNSTAKTIAKNSGMFWSWFQSSAILDNTFLYFNLGLGMLGPKAN